MGMVDFIEDHARPYPGHANCRIAASNFAEIATVFNASIVHRHFFLFFFPMLDITAILSVSRSTHGKSREGVD